MVNDAPAHLDDHNFVSKLANPAEGFNQGVRF
jgi:hypothetical protein